MARPKKIIETEDPVSEDEEICLMKTYDGRKDLIITVAANLFVKYINDRTKIDSVINQSIDDAIKFVDAINKVDL
jgi:hypothetical protein